ncbi:sensor domain-containing diguanylate cyclase [Halopseudomonas salegens]|uniref:sensor domain-containing diguanylate cyclase n=1 Tax=Halopseudomonas salegens TaxID=1434072 RepID=UPI00155FE6DB|nr:diguanylate cyclase [Halopseudomonas salegens]
MSAPFADNDLLEASIEAISDAVLITDAQLDHPGPFIVYANHAFCQLTGYTPSELEGCTPRILQGPETDRELLRTMKSQLRSAQTFNGETVNYRKDGTAFRMQWSIRPYPSDAEPEYYIAVQRDVSSLRDLEQHRRQLQRLVDIQTQVGNAGLDLQSLREQIAEIGLVVTGADGAAVEEAIDGEMVYTAAAGGAESSVGMRLPIAGSLSGACYRAREPIHCRDTHIEPRVAREAADRVGFRSGLLVPLIYADECFGVFKVYAGRIDAFSASDMEVLSMASQVLASSLANARRFKGERDRRRLLVDSLPILIAFIDPQLRYREINATYTRWYDLPADQIIGRPVADIMGEAAFANIEPYMLAALSGQHVAFESLFPHPSGRIIPVAVDYTPLRGNQGEVQGFYAMVRDVSDRKRAERDPLTDTLNRRGFDDQLELAFATARRYERPLALIFLDLDHFKSINDRYGHTVGDDVLCAVARDLCAAVRDSDIVSRWGGEEFVILAPETPLIEAEQLANRLCRMLAEQHYSFVGQVTASFGVAELTPKESKSDFIRRADQALYAAKTAGRNRVERARGPE